MGARMLPGAPGWRAVRVDKHDRRLFTPTPWGSPSWERGPPFRRGSAAGSTTLTEKRYVRGMRAPAARPRDGRGDRLPAGGTRRWSPRSGCATDRGGRPTASPSLQLTACGDSPVRPRFVGRRRSNRIFFLAQFALRVLNLHSAARLRGGTMRFRERDLRKWALFQKVMGNPCGAALVRHRVPMHNAN